MNPKFNMNGAESIIGRHVIIDTEVRDFDETLIERRELHGTIERVIEHADLKTSLLIHMPPPEFEGPAKQD